MKEIFDYHGTLRQIKRWDQELLGYDFIVFYCVAKMMKDVDALTCPVGSVSALCIIRAADICPQDAKNRRLVCGFSFFLQH